MSRNRRERVGPAFWVGMVLLALTFIVPILWMALTSIRTTTDSRTFPVSFIPKEITLRAYEVLFGQDQNPVGVWFLNSLVAAVGHTVLVLVVSTLAAYALARMEFRGRNLLFGIVIATLFIPGFIFMMPNYLTMQQLGWLDTLLAIIVPSAANAFGVFFMRQFFLSIPKELEEAARIDGAGTFTTLVRIVLPLAKPALVTLGVLSFLASWNEFIWPVFVLFSPEALTLPVGLATLQSSHAYLTDYPVVMAGATIAAVPVLLLYIVVQRYVIEGVATSGIKG